MIYLVLEDTKYGKNFYAYKTREKAQNKMKEIMLEYPEHLRSIDALCEENIYLSIEECELEE